MSLQNFTALLLNLDRDRERLAQMQAQLAQAGIVYSRQPGILGDDLPDDLRAYFFDAAGCSTTNMKRGEIGCYASHLLAMRRVASGEMGFATLIMEDDLVIAPDLLDILERAQQALPLGWDILRVSSVARRACASVARLDDKYDLVRYSKIPNGAGAYLITINGAQKFLERGVRGLTFDDDLRRPWFHGMATFGISPPPVTADAAPSSIDVVEGGRFDDNFTAYAKRWRRGDHFHIWGRLHYNLRFLGLGRWSACVAINAVDMMWRLLSRRSLIAPALRLFPAEPQRQTEPVQLPGL